MILPFFHGHLWKKTRYTSFYQKMVFSKKWIRKTVILGSCGAHVYLILIKLYKASSWALIPTLKSIWKITFTFSILGPASFRIYALKVRSEFLHASRLDALTPQRKETPPIELWQKSRSTFVMLLSLKLCRVAKSWSFVAFENSRTVWALVGWLANQIL